MIRSGWATLNSRKSNGRAVEISGCRSLALFAGALAVVALASGAAAEQVYSVQLGSYSSRGEASARLEQAGPYKSATTIESELTSQGEVYRVLLGRQKYYVEAWALRRKLGEELGAGAFIRQWNCTSSPLELSAAPSALPFQADDLLPGTSGATDPPTPKLSYKKALEQAYKDADLPSSVTVSAATLTKQPPEMTRKELLDTGFGATTRTVAVPALENFADRFDSDTSAPAARIKLVQHLLAQRKFEETEEHLAEIKRSGTVAQIRLAKHIEAYSALAQRQKNKAMPLFQAVADDKGYARSIRRDAMRRYAFSAAGTKDHGEAWLAFRQIAATADGPGEKAEAKVQLAAIAYEQVLNGKGTWAEVLELCDEVTQLSDAPRKQKATAALMHMEAQQYARNLEGALAEADAILASYTDQRRELLTARVWRGSILFDLRRFDEAQAAFESVLSEVIAAKDKFADFDPRARALGFLAYIAAVKHDSQKLAYYTNLLQTEFPNSSELAQVMSLRITP